MRDPSRIDRMLKQIEQLWKRYPDWRFGQLIFNVFDGAWDGNEVRFFYLDDDTAEKVIENRLEGFQGATRSKSTKLKP